MQNDGKHFQSLFSDSSYSEMFAKSQYRWLCFQVEAGLDLGRLHWSVSIITALIQLFN